MNILPDQFYYHFKRDSSKGLEHGAYLILGLGLDTEDRKQQYVVTKPLYFCSPKQNDETGISYLIRPVEFFEGEIERDNYSGKRFILIEDAEVINYLKQTKLYKLKFLDE